MKKNPDGWLVMTDLDGSLLNSKKKVSEENKTAILSFIKKGGKFTIATGRTELTSNLATEVVRPNCPIALYNGAAIYDMEKERFLWKKTLNYQELRPVLEQIMEKWPDICIQIFAGGPLMLVNSKGTEDPYIVNEKQPYIKCSLEEVPDQILKVMFSAQNGVLRQIESFVRGYGEKRFAGGYEMFFSAEYYMEIVPPGCSKGECLKKICFEEKIELSNTIAFGDHFNDIDMLRIAGTGIAPENAIREAKEAATLCVAGNNESPLAEFLKSNFEL